VGASPTRQPLQPEAIGAVMEVAKWLKPSISVSQIGDSASVRPVKQDLNLDRDRVDPILGWKLSGKGSRITSKR
jgi:hypothetical protein